MFFIGIFGIQQKQKEISMQRNIICPICEALGSYQVIKSYHFFHIFFIPVFKWNVAYYIQTSCCKKLVKIGSDIGKQIEQGITVELRSEDIVKTHELSDSNICSHCGERMDSRFTYCPYCGNHLNIR